MTANAKEVHMTQMNKKYYTDYPVDDSKVGTNVEIEVLTYDRDKYCRVKVGDNISEIKAGYIFTINKDGTPNYKIKKELYRLPTYIGEKSYTRLETLKAFKKLRKNYRRYTVMYRTQNEESVRIKFSSLADAVNYIVGNIPKFEKSLLSIFRESKRRSMYISECILDIEALTVFDYAVHSGSRKDGGKITYKHYIHIAKTIKKYKKEKAKCKPKNTNV